MEGISCSSAVVVVIITESLPSPVATKAHTAALIVFAGSKPLPGETLLSSHPQPDDSSELADGMWGGKTGKLRVGQP